MENVTRFPLAWPIGRPRTAGVNIKNAAFGSKEPGRGKVPISIAEALDRVEDELRRLGAADVVVSSNLPLNRAGDPRGDRGEPADCGVAVYFDLKKLPHCLSCDRWSRVADNIAAIAAHVEAVRGQLRWGVADVAQAFAGFKALPPPASWWAVLGFVGPVTSEAEVRARARELMQTHHPDRGGSPARAAEIGEALQAALAAIRTGAPR